MRIQETQATRLKEMELRKQVTAIITEKVREMMKEGCGMRWIGSKADLLELLHEVYVHGTLLTPDMRPIQMKTLVTKCFSNLGLSVMHNCYARTSRAEQRKGIHGGCIADRLLKIIEAGKHPEVVFGELIKT